MREYKRAALCFAVLAVALVSIFFITPGLETFLQGFGGFAAAFIMFMALLRNAKNAEQNAQRSRSTTSSLFAVLAIVFISVLLVFLFDFVLQDLWAEFVPLAVSRFLEGMAQGVGLGFIVYLIAIHGGSYAPNREGIHQALRGLGVVVVAFASLTLAVVSVYVAIEYVLGPIVRLFA